MGDGDGELSRKIAGDIQVNIVVGLPTRNRSRQCGELLAQLAAQSDKDFRTILVDDNSDQSIPFPVGLDARVFKTKPYHEEGKMYDSLVADNVIFKEAYEWGCDVLLHLDDDGYIQRDLVKSVRAWFMRTHEPFWGCIFSVDPDDRKTVIDLDVRLRFLKDGAKSFCMDEAFNTEHGCYQFGSLWACPMKLLHDMGGHDMRWLGKLGCDSRLGVRIGKQVKTWFTTEPSLSFFHIGYSKYREKKLTGKMTEVMEHWLAPQLSNCDNPVIANGGVGFWGKFSQFGIEYERVV
jgi:hypothetical protein